MYKTEKLLIEELNHKGYMFSDINHLFNQSNPLPSEVVSIILKWVTKIYSEHLGAGDCLVRSLISAADQFDPSLLIDLFGKSELNDTVKCSIGYVLSIAKTYDITEWIKNQLLVEEHSFKRAGLLFGIVEKGGFKTKDELRQFLKTILDKYGFYEQLQKLFQKYGSKEDIPFLEQKASQLSNKRTAREIQKVADKLRSKKREAIFLKP